MDVGGMQSRLAAIAARPLRFRADQAHTAATGVVMHFPVNSKKSPDIFIGKEIRRSVWSVQHANFPCIAILRDQ